MSQTPLCARAWRDKCRVPPAAKPIRVATEWKDLAAFEDFLVRRLSGQAE